MPWGWLLLGILEDCGGSATLQKIYRCIDRDMAVREEEDSSIIDARLLQHNLRYGDRPIYQHTVRGCLSSFRKRGLVERIGRGVYRMTEAGSRYLEEYRSSSPRR